MKCIYCGRSQKDIVEGQRPYKQTINCPGHGKHRFLNKSETWKHLEAVRFGLANGFSTEDIAADIGIQYHSVLISLQRYKHVDEHRAMMNRRQAEWDEYKVTLPSPADRPRCEHGAWTSRAGVCEHGAMGRRASRSAA